MLIPRTSTITIPRRRFHNISENMSGPQSSHHNSNMDHQVSTRERDWRWTSHRIVREVQAISKLLPSPLSIQVYLMINGPLVIFGCILHLLLCWTERVWSSSNPAVAVLLQVLILFMKNFLLLVFIDSMTKSKQDIVVRDKEYEEDEEVASHSSWPRVIKTLIFVGATETAELNISKVTGLLQFSSNTTTDNMSSADHIISSLTFFGTFIIVSFVFEIIFDFFHYWNHRILHLNPLLYKSLHSLHHHHSNPTVYHTFNDSVFGTIFTNAIPHLITLYLCSFIFLRPMYHSEHTLLLVYKAFIEISGHSGKELGKSSSFPQFKWLPIFFGIELYTCDHHTHHRNPKTNFSKRFVLWDKVFSTHFRNKNIEKSG